MSRRRHWSHSLRLLVFSAALGVFICPSLSASPGKEKTSKEERRRQKAIQKEMESPYKKWLTQEVPYIITDE